ncbi:MAG: hypothetical protein Q9170_000682 [Blastenia crenularia]
MAQPPRFQRLGKSFIKMTNHRWYPFYLFNFVWISCNTGMILHSKFTKPHTFDKEIFPEQRGVDEMKPGFLSLEAKRSRDISEDKNADTSEAGCSSKEANRRLAAMAWRYNEEKNIDERMQEYRENTRRWEEMKKRYNIDPKDGRSWEDVKTKVEDGVKNESKLAELKATLQEIEAQERNGGK